MLSNIVFGDGALDSGSGSENPWKDTSDSDFQKISADELAKDPTSVTTDSNWNRLSDPQKQEIYSKYLGTKEFADKFKSEQSANGINIGSLGNKASYDSATKTLTAGSQKVKLSEFKNSNYNFNVVNGKLQITDDAGNIIESSKEENTNFGSKQNSDGTTLTADLATINYDLGSTKASLVTATNVKINDDYLSADNARMFTQTITKDGKSTIISASNVEDLIVKGSNLTFSHADSIVTGNSWLATDVFSFKGNIETFRIKSADIVIANGNQIIKPNDTTFAVYQENTIIIPKESAVISDTNGAETEFSTNSGFVIIMYDGTYIVTKGNLTQKNTNYNETIIANTTIKFTTDQYLGIICMEIEPNGIYTYHNKNKLKSFAVGVPIYGGVRLAA